MYSALDRSKQNEAARLAQLDPNANETEETRRAYLDGFGVGFLDPDTQGIDSGPARTPRARAFSRGFEMGRMRRSESSPVSRDLETDIPDLF